MGMSQISPNERLRILQKVLGYRSQQAFADALGIKQGSLSDIYRAKNGIGVSGQIKIALSKHGVNIDWLDTARGYTNIKNPSVNQRFTEGFLFTTDAFTDAFVQTKKE